MISKRHKKGCVAVRKLTFKTKLIAVFIAFYVFVTAVTMLLNIWIGLFIGVLSIVALVFFVKAIDLISNIGVLDLKLIRFSKKFSKLCREASNIVIMGHKFSDLDSIGAGYGLYSCLKHHYKVSLLLNKENTLGRPLVDLICYSGPDCKYYGESDVERLIGDNTLLVIVDTHRPSLMDFERAYEKANRVVIIDHHLRAPDFASKVSLFFLKTSASSASEICTAIIKTLSTRQIDRVAANALFAGIMLDTKNFVMNTGPDTFRIASYLRQQKAEPKTSKQLFSESLEVCKRKYEIVADAHLYEDCAISKSEINDGYSRVCAAQAADELLTISGVRASFVICPSADKINISARSFGDMNVKRIMEKLGGGGHRTVAACQIRADGFDMAYKLLLKAIDEYKTEQMSGRNYND